MKKRIEFNKLGLTSLILSTLLLTACGDDSENENSKNNESVKAIAVTAQKPEQATIQKSFSAFGSVISKSTPTIAAQTSGKVLQLNKKVGDEVNKGDVIAQLEDTIAKIDVTKAKANIEATKARIANQKLTINRLNKLHESDSYSKSGLDEALTKMEELEARLRVDTQSLKAAEFILSKTTITSPIDGKVQTQFISEGDFVTTGSPVYKVVSAKELWAELPIPQLIAANLDDAIAIEMLTPTSKNKVTTDTLSSTPSVNVSNRSLTLYTKFSNPGDWYPGASVTANIKFKPNTGIIVPIKAVLRDKQGFFVYIIENNQAKKQRISIGEKQGNSFEVKTGLTSDNIVIVEGVHLVKDSSIINISNYDNA